MAEFKIYKSEAGVRLENAQLRREIEAVKADNARLRALAGEAPLVVAAAPARQAAVGESFKSGNCTVSIGPAAGPAQISPVAAAAAPRQARQPAAARSPVEAQPQTQTVGVQKEVDADDGVLRFSMIELQ